MPEVPHQRVARPESDEHVMALAPALLVGAPRSGTTWLQRMLLAHPRCCGGQESHFLATFAKVLHDFEHKRDMPRPHGLAAYLTRAELLDSIRGLWVRTFAETIASKPGATLLLEKTPDHAMHLDFASELLPACRVIHLVRDSRAVAASLIRASREPWGREWAPRTPDAAAQRWLECVEAAERFGESAGPSRFLRVHYESLHRSPSRSLRHALEFLGVGMSDSDLDRLIDAVGRDDTTSGIELRGELRDRSAKEPAGFVGERRVDGWRSTLGFRGARRVWSITQAAMRRLGYTREGWAGEGTA
jgi:LPS sulfotransferase NodH